MNSKRKLSVIIIPSIVFAIVGLTFLSTPIYDADEELPTITIMGTLSHIQPIDGPSYHIIPDGSQTVPMDNEKIYLYGATLNPSFDGKQVKVTGKIVENYSEYQTSKNGGISHGGDPSTSAIFVTDIVDLGEIQAVIEEEGILLIKNTQEYKTLVDEYGEDIISVKAVNLLDAKDALFLKEIDENFKQNPGCIIVLEYKNNEGYIYQLDKELNIVHQMNFLEFTESAKHVDTQVMMDFYNSLK